MKFSDFSKRQLLILGAFGLADFCNATCVSLQAPFFPEEAERKGATATEYGFVFGVFELVVFLISPYYGKKIKIVGPKTMFFCGILTSGICSVLFGLLDLVDGRYLFISLALLIRIVEALGNAAFLTASFAIIANEFPNNVATTFASLETFFGLGLIAGPTLGGVLYQIGGFSTPFMVLGGVLFLTALITRLALPVHEKYQANTKTTGRLCELLNLRGIPVCAATILSTSTSISFFSATLEPHVRQFNLTPIVLGLVFVVTGATYGSSAPVWGWLCDKYLRPKAVAVIGGIILIIGVGLVGPAPFIPLPPSLALVIIGLFFHGLGVGARLVSSFTDALQTALAHGLPNDLETYGMISGLWTSSFALGAFIGPTVSGFLYDNYGFPNASLFIMILVFILVIFECWYLFSAGRVRYNELQKNQKRAEYVAGGGTAESNQTVLEKLYHGSYQNNVGVGSNRVLNLVYSSETDLRDETSPLLAESPS